MKQKNKSISQIKKLLKKNNRWKDYKKFFPSRSTRFMFCFWQNVLNDSNIPIENLYNLEIAVLDEKYRDTMFINSYNVFANELTKYRKLNFANFALFFFYTWQASRFYRDERKKIPNIFTRSNFNAKNEKKRDYFYNWLKELRVIDPEFNNIILKLRKKGI